MYETKLNVSGKYSMTSKAYKIIKLKTLLEYSINNYISTIIFVVNFNVLYILRFSSKAVVMRPTATLTACRGFDSYTEQIFIWPTGVQVLVLGMNICVFSMLLYVSYTWAEDSVRLLLSKNRARSFNCPWCQVHGISFEWFPRPWQNTRSKCRPSRFIWRTDITTRYIFSPTTPPLCVQYSLKRIVYGIANPQMM